MARKGTTTPEQDEQIRELRLQGKTQPEIVAMVGVSRNVVRRVLKADPPLAGARKVSRVVPKASIGTKGGRGAQPRGKGHTIATKADILREYANCESYIETARRAGVSRSYATKVVKADRGMVVAMATSTRAKAIEQGTKQGIALRDKDREKRAKNWLKITDYGASLYGKASRQIARMEKQVEDWEQRADQIDAAKNPEAFTEALRIINSVRGQIVYQENELRKRIGLREMRETDSYAANLRDEASLGKEEQQYFMLGMKSAIEGVPLNRTPEQIRDGLLLKFGQLLEDVLDARASGSDVIFGGEDADMNGEQSE